MICLDAVRPRKSVHEVILPKLLNKSIIPLSREEVSNFCGNAIMLSNDKDEPVLVCSERARESYSKKNWQVLSDSYKIVSADLSTIETLGGGSARCMIAELA